MLLQVHMIADIPLEWEVLGNRKVLNEVLVKAGHDCVEVSFVNHTTFSVMLETLPFSTVPLDALSANPITSIFLFLHVVYVMIGH